MEIAKLAVAVLAGTIGGFVAAKVFGGKKDVQDEHIVLKVYGTSRDPIIEVPMRKVKAAWIGGTPCTGDGAFTVERIDRAGYEGLVAKLKKVYEAGPSRPPEEIDAEADAAIDAERAAEAALV